VRDAGLPGRLHAYDRCEWLIGHAPLAPDIPLEPGESFEPWLRRFVEAVDPTVHIRRQELREIRWDGGAIDILFLDAPKRWADVWKALALFGPHLVPGESLVVFQDYLFHLSPEIALAMDRLRDAVTPLHTVTPGGTVSFRLDRPLTAAMLDVPPLEGLAAAEVEAAWERILGALPPEPRAQLEPGLGALLFQAGDVDAAVRAVKAQAARGVGLEAWRAQRDQLANYRALRPLFHALELRRPDWDLLLDREEALRAKLARRRDEVHALRARVRDLEAGTLRGTLRAIARRGRAALGRRRTRPAE
jgi:hypothetical protein